MSNGHYPHPLTGRQDKVRTDKNWRARIERLESQLGYIICGSKNSKTGEPCTKQPNPGRHRCPLHDRVRNRGHFKDTRKKLDYPPNVGYGMNLMQFIVCHRCHTRDDCPVYPTVDHETDDRCPIEMDIFDKTMQLKDKYTVEGDYIQESMLESIAFCLIHKFRAEKQIAFDGMVIREITGSYQNGERVGFIEQNKAHPLLQHISSINKEFAAFAKAMIATPEAIRRFEGDKEAAKASSVLSDILKTAHKKRFEEDVE